MRNLGKFVKWYEAMDWFDVAQGVYKLWAVVNAAMNLRVP
jgi:hypothetical protein